MLCRTKLEIKLQTLCERTTRQFHLQSSPSRQVHSRDKQEGGLSKEAR